MASEDWKWKSKEAAEGGLLYEPGNWGDILKAAWLLRILESITGNYLDVFAGAPHYPLSRESRRRLQETGDSVLNKACACWVSNSLWPSAASLAAVACGEDRQVTVYDRDEPHQKAFAAVETVQVIEAADGWKALEENRMTPDDLLLIDPYDFLSVWREQAELVCSQPSSVLIYIYNRSARKVENLRNYRDFRNQLDTLLARRRFLTGRIPADGFLPDAHHEMLFIPSASLAGNMELCSDLREVTLSIESVVLRSGVFIDQE